MIMLQNNVIMRALREFSHTIRDFFSYGSDFEFNAWSNFFRCAITFIKQPSLQLEKFSENKKLKILNMYGDMRKTMGTEIKQMWFNLGQNKFRFVPDLVGDFLEMALIDQPDLRKETIPVFFDMIQCEYYSSRFQQDNNRYICINCIFKSQYFKENHLDKIRGYWWLNPKVSIEVQSDTL